MRKTTDLWKLGALLLAPAALAVLPLLAAAPVAAAGEGAATGGKQIFLAQKCNLCHSIDSQGITRTSKSEKTKGPDLSNVGGTHLAPWITQWLKKEVAGTDGKKHVPNWKGTDAELKTLADWLATLKKT
jgi:mono/diheme cytochrome c family protein